MLSLSSFCDDYTPPNSKEAISDTVSINEGTVDAVEYNVFIREEGKPLTRFIPDNQRRCGPPSKVSECMSDGWAMFDFPTTFANQGDCVQYVLQRPRVNLLVPQDPLQ
jgi:hypothetical protein